MDVYLDISPPYMTGRDALSERHSLRLGLGYRTPECGHRRDFVFNAGFYTDWLPRGRPPVRYQCQDQCNPERGFPQEPGTAALHDLRGRLVHFEHRFRDNGFGVLAVDLTIKNSLGVPLMMWTLSDPSDVIATTVGGNRYGWFVINEFPFLAFENSALVGFQDYCVLPEHPRRQGHRRGLDRCAGGKANFGLTAQVKNNATQAAT